jgi:hypothetical protein
VGFLWVVGHFSKIQNLIVDEAQKCYISRTFVDLKAFPLLSLVDLESKSKQRQAELLFQFSSFYFRKQKNSTDK